MRTANAFICVNQPDKRYDERELCLLGKCPPARRKTTFMQVCFGWQWHMMTMTKTKRPKRNYKLWSLPDCKQWRRRKQKMICSPVTGIPGMVWCERRRQWKNRRKKHDTNIRNSNARTAKWIRKICIIEYHVLISYRRYSPCHRTRLRSSKRW